MNLAAPARHSRTDDVTLPRRLPAPIGRALAGLLTVLFVVSVPAARAQATPPPAGVVATPGKPAIPASVSSPTGDWRTFGDGGDKPRGVVRITENDGVLTGTILRSLVPGEDPNKVCSKCTDERRDKPLRGMAIITGMKLVDGEYRGGEILDPDTGATYRCLMRLADNGQRLIVRGYIGISLLGRTQEWVRAE